MTKKVFTEHGANAFESSSSRIRDGVTPFNRTTARLVREVNDLIEQTNGLQNVSIAQAALIAEKVLTIAHRRASIQTRVRQQQSARS